MKTTFVSRSRHAWRALAVLALTSLPAACGSAQADAPVHASAVAPIAVAFARAEERALPTTIEVTGSLEADAVADIAPEIDGRVSETRVERGQLVAEGEVLFTLDARDAESRLAEALALEAQTEVRLALADGLPFDAERTADAREARVTMERAEKEYQRFARLVEEGAVSRSEYDSKRATWLEAKERHTSATERAQELYRSLEAQRARVALAKKRLEDTTLRAPFSGRVMERAVDVGQYVKTGARLATLVRTDSLRIELEIPEVAADSVRAGGSVQFSVQAHKGRRFTGKIAFVGPGLERASRTLVAEAVVDNADGVLQPGLFATASLELAETEARVVVPAAAVRSADGVSWLFVIENEHAAQRFVQLGRRAGEEIEIVRGLAAGEQVVVQGTERLTDGALLVARATVEQ